MKKRHERELIQVLSMTVEQMSRLLEERDKARALAVRYEAELARLRPPFVSESWPVLDE